ncbi:MAG: flavin monoamine oxidase family protein [Methylocystis sp.]|uniref:flavin monoamine oxidase family protein n=1 Tax=Methylocystis sp. TaxID=1911079 RepID=UPI003DA618EF
MTPHVRRPASPLALIVAAALLVASMLLCVTPATAQEEPERDVDVVIVGGGLSGLCTAFHLRQAGVSFTLLELAPRLGGRIRTAAYPGGLRAESGLAEFWEGNPALEVARALNVPLDHEDTTFSSMVLQGRVEAFVQKSNAAFLEAVLEAKENQAYQAWDHDINARLKILDERPIPSSMLALKDVSFGRWLDEQKLPPRVGAFIRATLEPEIGTTLESVSALDGIAEWHVFTAPGARPHHVVGGNQRLVEALAAHLGEAHLRLNKQVTHVIQTPSGVEVRAIDTATSHILRLKAKAAVVAIPLYRLFELQFTPRLSNEHYQAIQTQGWGSYFTAHVTLDPAAERFWTVDGRSILPLLAGGSLGVLYSGVSADGQTGERKEALLNLLVHGPAAEGFNARTGSLDDVQATLENALDALFPGIRPLIHTWTFYRYHPRAIAAWPVGRSRFDALSDLLRRPFGNIYFAGDFTESSHSDGAALSARRVSEQLIERLRPRTTVSGGAK